MYRVPPDVMLWELQNNPRALFQPEIQNPVIIKRKHQKAQKKNHSIKIKRIRGAECNQGLSLQKFCHKELIWKGLSDFLDLKRCKHWDHEISS